MLLVIVVLVLRSWISKNLSSLQFDDIRFLNLMIKSLFYVASSKINDEAFEIYYFIATIADERVPFLFMSFSSISCCDGEKQNCAVNVCYLD